MNGKRFEGLAVSGEREDRTVNIVEYFFCFSPFLDVSILLLDRDETGELSRSEHIP